MNKNRIFAVGVVALLLSVAVVTPILTQDSSAETEEDPLLYSDGVGNSYGVIPILVIAAGYSLKALAVTAGVSFLGGFAAGYLAADHFSDPAGDNEEYYKQLRQMKAEDLVIALDTIANISGSMIPADTTLWSFTSSYWNRATELVVSEFWSESVPYNPEAATHRALLRTNIENYLYNWQATLDKNYNGIMNLRSEMTGECWGGMTLGVSWSNGSFEASSDTSSKLYFDLTQYVKGASSGSTVYIDANHWDSAGTYDVKTSGTLYNLGSNSVTLKQIRIYDDEIVNNTITIPAGGSYATKATDSGLYEITTNGAFIAGPLTKAASKNAAEVGGCLVFNTTDGVRYALPSGDNIAIGTAGREVTIESATFEIEFKYEGTNQSESTSPVCGSTDSGHVNVVRDWNNLIIQTSTIVDLANDAGETLWGIFDAAQESNSFLSPSSITTTVDGIDLTVEQKQAIYIQAMSHIGDYWKENNGELTETEFITNLESIGLIVHGDIYYNGQLWMEDAIFTPYMTVSTEQEIISGKEIQWDGPGFAMVWAQKESLANWNGETSTTEHCLVNLDSNYSIVVNEIEKDGTSTGKVVLSPTIIERATLDPNDPSEFPEPVKVLDASMLIMIIMIELALILFLIGYILGQPMVGAIVAIIVIIIAAAFSETIASIFLGTFSWDELLPF